MPASRQDFRHGPEPTVLPPSRIAKSFPISNATRFFSSRARLRRPPASPSPRLRIGPLRRSLSSCERRTAVCSRFCCSMRPRKSPSTRSALDGLQIVLRNPCRSPGGLPSQFPDVALHVVAGHHPEAAIVDIDARRVSRCPRCIRHLIPVQPIGRVPRVLPIAPSL